MNASAAGKRRVSLANKNDIGVIDVGGDVEDNDNGSVEEELEDESEYAEYEDVNYEVAEYEDAEYEDAESEL